MKVSRTVTIILAMLLGSTGSGAESVPEPGDSNAGSAAELPALETITVSPAQRPPAILAPEQQPPGPPVPLAESQRSHLQARAAGESAIERDTFRLDARTPFVDGKGYLKLSLPLTLHPESPIVFDQRYPSRVSVHLHVEEGGTYLVDFAVAAGGGAGSYRVESEFGSVLAADPDGKLGHVLLALRAASSGWTSLRLARDGGGYSLYAVEITHLQ